MLSYEELEIFFLALCFTKNDLCCFEENFSCQKVDVVTLKGREDDVEQVEDDFERRLFEGDLIDGSDDAVQKENEHSFSCVFLYKQAELFLVFHSDSLVEEELSEAPSQVGDKFGSELSCLVEERIGAVQLQL